MIIRSTRFGELDLPSDAILHFPYGLPGFPDARAFALLPYQPGSPFAYLQSLHDPDLAFIIVEPFGLFENYEFELSDQIVAELSLSEDNPPCIYNIVTIPEKSEEMTANLLAPLVINRQKNIAVQIVLEKAVYNTRHRLFPNGLPQQASERGK